MKARKLVEPEVVAFLDSRVPKEITDEILIYVARSRVVRAYRAVLNGMGTDDEDEVHYFTKVAYRGVIKGVSRCRKCTHVEVVVYVEAGSYETLFHTIYPSCRDGCLGDVLSEKNSLGAKVRVHPVFTETGMRLKADIDTQIITLKV